jgi:8-oxo-dGTP pyrophosphatase MutT (NUDIX family)
VSARPTKRAGGGALIRDRGGRVLLVRPSYKPGWEIPGGVVELDESPRQCCAREVLEELGLVVAIGRLLVVDWLPALGPKTEGLLFVFDGGVFEDERFEAIRLQAEELLEWKLVDPAELPDHLAPGMARRMAAAVAMAESGETTYLEWGNPIDAPMELPPR